MATVAPSSDQASDLMQKLSLESQPKAIEISEPIKKIPAKDSVNGQVQSYDRSLTPVLQDFIDPSMYYHPNGYLSNAYYYGGYDGTGTEWDNFANYMSSDGVEMSPGVFGDNGSMMYHGYGYAPYAPYSPAGSQVPTMGHDGQLYGPQQYQYPYFQPSTPTNGSYTPAVSAKGDVTTSAAPDQKPLSVESANDNKTGAGVKGSNGSAPVKSTYQNSSYNYNGSFGRGGQLAGGMSPSGYQDPRYSYDALRSPIPNSNNVSSLKNQNLRPHSHYMGLHQPRPMSAMGTAQGYMNRMYPNKMYGNYSNAVRSGFTYGSNGYDSRGRGWYTVDNKYRPRGRGNGFFGYGNENVDGLNELNRGPRAKVSKTPKGCAPVTIAVKGQNLLSNGNDDEKAKLCEIPDREQYNLPEFSVEYTDAKFFIIKSYSEDDVHKSIKYNVWASTPNGNKKLDAAYKEAQEKTGSCPIFLLFSVNTSGQFVGLAEMVGPVDFDKSLEYWQQDKWTGCFSLKWHIVKDVPNNLLKHITLEYNENKPVTNSRDTQEVKLEQGTQVLKIFKEHSSKTCILDDFGFYESRQKAIQEKKAKLQQFQKQVWGTNPTDEKNKEGTNAELSIPIKSLEVISEANNLPATVVLLANGDKKLSENGSAIINGDVQKGTKPIVVLDKKLSENGSAAINGDVQKVTKPIVVLEKKIVANGVANGA